MSSGKAQVEVAKLRPRRNDFFADSVLVDCLPYVDEWTEASILDALEPALIKPPLDILTYPAAVKIDHLKRCIGKVFVATKEHLELVEAIDDLIRYGYYCRTPVDMRLVVQGESILKRDSSIEDEHILTEEELYVSDDDIDKYGDKSPNRAALSIVGNPGSGKSCSIEHVLALYPQVLEHKKTQLNANFKQVVWLKVDCPSDAHQISLCSALLKALDEALDSTYVTRISESLSATEIQELTAKTLNEYFVGLIVFDHMQILEDKNKVGDFLMFFAGLCDRIESSLIFVGSPKEGCSDINLLSAFARKFHIAKMSWGWPMEQEVETRAFNDFVDKLGAYNFVDGKALDKTTRRVLFNCSQAIPDMLLKLYFMTQIQCIAKGLPFTGELVKSTFVQHFSKFEQFISTLFFKSDSEINSYYEYAVSEAELIPKIDALIDEVRQAEDARAQLSVEENVADDIAQSAHRFAIRIIRILANYEEFKLMSHKQCVELELVLSNELIESNNVDIAKAMQFARTVMQQGSAKS